MKYFKLLQNKHCMKLNNFDFLVFNRWYINKEQRKTLYEDMINKLETFQYSNINKKNVYNAVCNIKFDMEFKIPDA